MDQSQLARLAADAFDRRIEPLQALATETTALALACQAMADRFRRGGRLLVFGNGAGTTDAQHVAVEFVHPATVGRRALPAVSLSSDAATLLGVSGRLGIDRVYAHQIDVLGRPDDIALGLSGTGSCPNVIAGLRAARHAGMLTLALVGGDGGGIVAGAEADHCLSVGSEDPLVVKEVHVTAYHLLWELVQVFLDAPEVSAPPSRGGVEGLYPFLYGGGPSVDELIASTAQSAREKIGEIAELRRQVGERDAAALAACAIDLAEAFRRGATLLAFGNGGSSTDAQDVVHTFVDPAPPATPLPALGLTNDVAVLTALSNDVSFDVVFARQVQAFGRPGDIAVALSTSGGSANVLAGLMEADRLGLMTIGLTGYGGGPMANLACLQHLFAVPSSSVHRIQEVQTTVYHVLWELTTHVLAAAPLPPLPARD